VLIEKFIKQKIKPVVTQLLTQSASGCNQQFSFLLPREDLYLRFYVFKLLKRQKKASADFLIQNSGFFYISICLLKALKLKYYPCPVIRC